MKLSLVFLFGVALTVGTDSLALTALEIKDEIRSQIAERHPDPNAGAFWSTLGPDALPVIKQMLSETTSSYEKSWLIDGLSHFDDPTVGALLQSQIESSNNEVLKRKMLNALVESQGEKAYDFAEKYLSDDDANVRLAVAKALKNYAFERSKKRLSEFESAEKLAWVKLQYQKEENGNGERMKRSGSVFQHYEIAPSPTPLPEKLWAGDWNGNYITPDQASSAVMTLTLKDEKAPVTSSSDQKWKVELKLPKLTKFVLKEKDLVVVYYQTAKRHWIEVRNKKDDSVFMGSRK